MRMKRLLPLTLLAALAAASCAPGAPEAPARKNVLFILVDDLKPTLGCYGDAAAITPHIDRLAARSLVFTAAYANQAVCAPSRHALLTGLRPTTIGVYDLNTPFRTGAPDAVTMPERFAAAGYSTQSLGKVYHPGHGNETDPRAWAVPSWDPKGGPYGAQREDRPATLAPDVDDDALQDGKIAAEAVRRLTEASAHPDKPFMMFVGFKKPHLPFVAPKKYWDLHADRTFAPVGPSKPPEGAPEFAATTWGELRNYSDIPDVGPVDEAKAGELIRGYHAATSYMDAQVGRVIDALDRLGLADKTIIVLWGDHGWHLGDHGFWCKHTNYEQAARIPLMVCAPGITRAGTRTAALIESVDLYPSVCELAGVAAPAGLDGVSQVRVLRDPSVHVRDVAMHVYPRQVQGRGQWIGRALRTARHRLVEWKLPGAEPSTAILELYDYEADPAETRNLAAEQPELAARLQARLAEYPEARPQVVAEGGPKRRAGE
jgi:iduronate 2-sulfatase